MSEWTRNLGLLKKDPIADRLYTFSVGEMLNGNWDKIDDYIEQNDKRVSVNEEKRHGHENKILLEKINKTKVDIWDTVTRKANQSEVDQNSKTRHSHINKSVIDQFSQEKLNNLEYNTFARHDHANSTVIEKITQPHIDRWETVLRKADQVEVDKNSSLRHYHDNGEILSRIKQSSLDKWNSGFNHTNYGNSIVKTSSFILTSEYVYRKVYLSNSKDINITVTKNMSIAEDAEIVFISEGVGKVTFIQGSGAIIKSKDNNRVIDEQYDWVSIIYRGNGVWHLCGALTS